MRKRLIASDGCVLTNGYLFGKVVDLAVGDEGEGWHEITEAEYQEILKEQETE